MEAVTTTDGVSLGYVRRGSGSMLVLVHGGATDHRCFEPLIESLAARHETIAYDRRGRGMSGGGSSTSLDREARDLVELVAHLGGPVDLLGYSYGGLACLHALAHHDLQVGRAVVYEPPMGVSGMFPGSLAEDIRRLAAAGDYDEAGRRFVRDTFLLGEGTVERMRGTPLWQAVIEAGPTLPGEIDNLLAARPEDYAAVDVPTRVLVQREGGNPAFRSIAERLAAALPNAEVIAVDGVPHFAMASHPAEFLVATGFAS